MRRVAIEGEVIGKPILGAKSAEIAGWHSICLHTLLISAF
jgi:hypothetical protein